MTTKAIVLAAGFGSRLMPYTIDRPKCLVELVGKSILERQMDVFTELGIADVHVVGGYKFEKFAGLGHKLIFNELFETTNMVSSLFKASEHFDGRSDVVVCYGDIVFETSVLAEILRCDSDVALVSDLGWENLWNLRMADPLSDAESFKVDAEGYITELGKKPHSTREIEGQFIGLIKFSRNFTPQLPDLYGNLNRNLTYDGQVFDQMYMTSFLQHLIELGNKIKAVPIERGWLEVDSVEDLSIYESLYASGDLDRYCRLGMAG